MRDFRDAVRALRATPVITVVAILSLALGIGANTAIFSIVDSLLLRALPVRDPGRLALVSIGEDQDSLTNPIWEEIRARSDLFGGAFAGKPSKWWSMSSWMYSCSTSRARKSLSCCAVGSSPKIKRYAVSTNVDRAASSSTG